MLVKEKSAKSGYSAGSIPTQFQKGNSGKKLGTKNKATLLKNKLLNYALKLNFDEQFNHLTIKTRKKLIRKYIRSIPKTQLLSLAAGMVPKEQVVKADGLEINVYTQIWQGAVQKGKEVDAEGRLIKP